MQYIFKIDGTLYLLVIKENYLYKLSKKKNDFKINFILNSFPEVIGQFAHGQVKLADLRGINLQNTHFFKFDFSYCCFDYADLNGCIFEQTSLQYSSFKEANLSNSSLKECFFMTSDFFQANTENVNENKCHLDRCNGWIISE